MRKKGLIFAAVIVLVAAGAAGFWAARENAAPKRASDVDVWPTPQASERVGDDVPIPASVTVEGDVEAITRQVVEKALTGGSGDGKLTVRFRTDKSLTAEGYALNVGRDEIDIASADPSGAFYAVQTLRQLVKQGKVLGVKIDDHPSLRLRGIVEGFYGRRWTYAEQQEQIDFAASVKSNSYVYAPKDDPYHRDRWREPYPADRLAELGELAKRAAVSHVQFTYSLAPGLSMCYSKDSDRDAIQAKLAQLHSSGIKSFALLLDDIDYAKWNCSEDQAEYGPPNRTNAARAQNDLLNDTALTIRNQMPDVGPLITVLTEYGDITPTPYKRVFRDGLDKSVVVMWTGTAVVPRAITRKESERAKELWGRKTLIWDNYPVNDYPDAAGRLFLGSYSDREPGLQVEGLLANPMSQAYASRVAMFEMADYAWNDQAYDEHRSENAYARLLAGGDEKLTTALLAFFDLNSWTAPRLAAELDEFTEKWRAGDKGTAVAGLRAYADVLAGAAKLIREKVHPGFVTDSAPWLDQSELLGKALQATADGLGGNHERFADSDELVKRLDKKLKTGDGKLEKFLDQAPEM
ncbi:beta-N-acetylglucosaminidase domain-containing protein [Lentzea rhizosphaerae]|uniref:Beta-N-acetylglucosaminidase domain-containing protein n=1 Tax=Lentzea rhizosphaerae TaxID=2041025 RepID=A0ABV8CAX9_9PSEU